MGDLDHSDALVRECHQIRTAVGTAEQQSQMTRMPELPAWRDVPNVTEFLRDTREVCLKRGVGAVVSMRDIGRSVLHLGRGDYAEAAAVLRDLTGREQMAMHTRMLPAMVEAAARSGDRESAETALRTLTARATAGGAPRREACWPGHVPWSPTTRRPSPSTARPSTSWSPSAPPAT
ncbi:hypothetical protein [Herbidospora sp. NBRC 101105]|uniref:hypothetical protein n=1 Tax=Herbidospora sp. NBRC 101105 TaxID=3032195 RepID=UPI0024A51151|nr:hypothetical protein [Herbidospora sp. NBRC 101105]GLX95948.1 hypothetical protein Hesp01_38980 [Herbidospora sp. NBRC 101105]